MPKENEGKHLWADEIPLIKESHRVRCPFGRPGDRLWVRETWAVNDYRFGWEKSKIITERYVIGTEIEIAYRADGEWHEQHEQVNGALPPWRPSIFMPRWASRINLEITNVRVERLQDISEEDAIAEGIERQPEHDGPMKYSIKLGYGFFNQPTAKECFQRLWSSINGPESWEANPFVWCIEFKRI